MFVRQGCKRERLGPLGICWGRGCLVACIFESDGDLNMEIIRRYSYRSVFGWKIGGILGGNTHE